LPQYTPPGPYFPLPYELVPRQPIAWQATPTGQSPASEREAVVLAELLKAYEAACAEGKTVEAKKFARAALIIEPTCFRKKR
jgi:hypothetical protein